MYYYQLQIVEAIPLFPFNDVTYLPQYKFVKSGKQLHSLIRVP